MTLDGDSPVGQGYTVVSDLRELMPQIPADTIISRTVTSNGLRATLFGFAAGQELTEHTAAFPAVLHFLDGEAEVMLGEEAIAAKPGTWITMPAHLPHAVKAQTPMVMLLLLLRS